MGGWGNFQDEHEPGTVGMEEAIGVKIEFQKYPTDADFWNNLPAQIAAKTAPDFISLTNELYLPYINDGLVVPLTSYVEDGTISCWDSIAQNLKDIWEIDGEIYGIPTHQSPAVFAINMNLWNEAGLTEDDFPETWDDVLEICQVFKDQLGLTGLCLNTQEFHFTQYALSFGGGWGLGKTINTPENAAALQFLIDAYHQGYVVTPKELGVGYDGSVLMTNDAAMSTGGSFVPPSVWSLDNYKELFADFPIMGWYKNTAISTLSVVLGNIVFTPMAGYGLARLRFPGKKVIFVCLMLSMMIPGQLVLLPQYIMMAQMGLVDTLAAIIIPYLSQSMFIFMARQFFYGIPEELEEAARIDGLGRFGTYVRIVLPISGVLIATIAIFNFTGTWNSYLVPSTFISTLEKFVLVVGLQTVNNEHFQQENLTLAGVFLLSFPVIIFFMFTQKFFVQGIATSGIKS